MTRGQYLAFLLDMRGDNQAADLPDWVKTVAWRDNDGNVVYDSKLCSMPMVNVSWIDAKRYCDWMSRKKGLQISLPTEVEWEYAARGPRSDLTTWFEPDRFVLSQEHRQVRPVGTVDADLSWCGAFDMGGNVAEWCFDNYDGKKLARQKNLTANPNDIYQYRGADERAQSAKEGIQKSIRGGSFGQSVYQCRTYNRRWKTIDSTGYANIGFRPVLLLPSLPDPADPASRSGGPDGQQQQLGSKAQRDQSEPRPRDER